MEEEKKYMMTDLLDGDQKTLNVGDVAEGKVIDIDKNSMYLDLSPFGTGIIFGREFLVIKDIIKTINIGDAISAKVVEKEGEKGYIELSLKEARQATVWKEAAEALEKETVLSVAIKEANKGGLMVNWQGVTGFLPASQLSPANYPKVSGGDKNMILDELKKLVGQKLDLKIITVEPKEDKLIFSEKTDKPSVSAEEKTDMIGKYSVGDELDAEVTGIVDFGVFVKLEENLEGLVHISEISWSLVEDLEKLYAVGDKIKVKVIEVSKEKISLSIKALTENPWTKGASKYKKDQEVEAVVIRYNDHGALVSVEEGISGLVHVSDFESPEDLREKISLGNSYKFKINIFDSAKQKMTLTLSK